MNIDYEKFIPCTDISLAAYLVSFSHIIKIDATDPQKVVFFFEDTSELHDSISGFWNNTVTIAPLEYFNNIKNLKTRIHLER